MLKTIEWAIQQYAEGEKIPMRALLGSAIFGEGIPLERIYKIAWTRWGISRQIVLETIRETL